ncbi:DNA polymerase iota-like [Lytechinus variegatus]|uniref:DNA polymerase iota-like n=1 Tax=Lytechinus variegatus TaxID=7654 RepID=UPI001BB12E3D|nr:DNA polymerase iota-like [Lytechinus variegatus]
MEGRWEEQDDTEDEALNEEDDIDWRMPSDLGSPSIKTSSLKTQLSSLTDGNRSEPCLQSKLGHSRTIVHIDLDCFYAQVEMLRNPALRDKPLGIQQKNIVVTTNYVARARGVSKLSYIKDALIKCPDLVLVSGEDLTNYRDTSTKVTELLEKFCPLVERLGFDENFMDVTQLVESRLTSFEQEQLAYIGHSYENDAKIATQCQCGCRERLTIGSHIAKEMRDTLKSKLGLTSCAGVATNKLLAKLVGGHHKPNDQTVLFSEWTDSFMQTFTKLRQIPGIGHSSGKKLKDMGIQNLEELRATQILTLTDQFPKQQAETMLRLAHGVDDTPVVSKGLPQSLSDEDSFKKVGTLQAAKEMMSGLIKNLIKRLHSDGRIPATMRLTVRKYVPGSWHRESRQTGISANLFHKQDDACLLQKLLEVAVGLLQKLINTNQPFHLTLINICFTNLRSKVTKGAIDTFFSKPAVKAKDTVSLQSQGSCEGKTREMGVQPPENDNSASVFEGRMLASGEVRGKLDCGTLSGSGLKEEKRKLTMLFKEQSSQKVDEANLRTAVSSTGKRDAKGSQSFFKKLGSSPSKKSKLCDGVFRTAGKQRSVDKEKRDQSSWTADANRDSPSGEFDDHSLILEETAHLSQSSKRSFEESSLNDTMEGNIDNFPKRLKNDLDYDAKPTISKQSVEEVEVPSNIDRSVFDALPSNMKEELIANWKREKKQKEDEYLMATSSQTLHKSKKSSSSTKKKHPPFRNTITNYFKH